MNVAKLDKDKLVLNKEEINIKDILNQLRDSFELFQKKEGAILNLKIGEGSHDLVADPVHMTNVVHNLTDNALKYSNENPVITITTKRTEKALLIEFTDQGIGIKKEHLTSIFEKFYRVPTGNVHNVKGFGLGLYYVKLIVESHKGEINVKSVPNKGTTFTIKIPFS